MKSILQSLEIILGLLLITSILLQQRGSGLGGAFGGQGAVYRSRRGAERFLFQATITLAICFVTVAVILLVAIRT